MRTEPGSAKEPRRRGATSPAGLAGGAVLCALMLLGAGPAAAGRGEDGTLKLLLWQAPTTANPHLSKGAKDHVVSRIVYEPLASFDADGTMVPFLAAEIPSLANGGIAADGRSVTWRLRPGVKWADGKPFTADDVLFTYAYITNPDVGATGTTAYQMVERIEALDELTVKVHFKDRDPAWARPFVGVTGSIIPRHVFEPYNGPNAGEAPANLMAVGTGPFRVAAFEEQDLLIIGEDVVSSIKIVFELNPHYREPDKPHFARIELRGGGDPRIAAEAVFQDGSADYAYNMQVDIAELDKLEALGRARLLGSPPGSTERIMFNFTDPNRATADGEHSSLQFPHPILSDRLVRQALTLAVDRNAIGALYGRTAPVISNLLISPKSYDSPHTSWTYDLAQASALLEQAGWIDTDGDGVRDKDGAPLRLVLQTSVNDVRERTLDIVRESLASIGVAIEPKVIDASIFFGPVTDNTNTTGHFYADLEMYARGNLSPDPDGYMRHWLCAEAAQKSNNWSGSNRARYCNPAYDALYEQTRTEFDPDKRRALFIAMNDLLIEDAALIPLVGRRPRSFGLSNAIALGLGPTGGDSEVWDIADWRRQEVPAQPVSAR